MRALSHAKLPKKIELPWSPVEVAARLKHLDGFTFFDTAGNLPVNYGKSYSIITALPEYQIMGDPDDWTLLEETWEQLRFHGPDCGFPLGGLCGWMDYEGSWHFGIYEQMLIYQHEDAQWYELGELSTMLREPELGSFEIGEFTTNFDKNNFVAAVKAVQEYIAAGDIYQVNLARKFSADISGGSLWPLYEKLREASPAPLAAWMNIGGREILCSSPETYLRISGREIETRPIKGTRPRIGDTEVDRRSAYELMTSEKEIAELVMITDLERNDIGQICEYGSVRVDEMLQLETLEHVYHLVSTVRGRLLENVDPISAMRACFPGGSITGAPKKRAMEIISELERSKRGLYTGALGYFGFNGESQLNIPIRTLVRENGSLHYHVGAGIVADSDPEHEFEETEHKARGLRLAIEAMA